MCKCSFIECFYNKISHLVCKHCICMMTKSEYGNNQVYIDYFILFAFC